MKKFNVLLMAAASLLIVACGSNESVEETTGEETEPTVYNLDTENTTLWWKGEENEHHYRQGYVDITEGTLTMEGEDVVKGNFTIDMSTISAEDEGLSEEKIAGLNSHLKDTAFFQVYQYPTVDVVVNGYKDGKLNTVITIMGTELEKDIPLKMIKTENGITFAGKFSLDISDVNMEYLESTNEAGEPSLKPVLEFDMNLVLQK